MTDRQPDIRRYMGAIKKLLSPSATPPIRSPSDPQKARELEERLRWERLEGRTWRANRIGRYLYEALNLSFDQIETCLRRRGHVAIQRGDLKDLLVPFPVSSEELDNLQQQYLEQMSKSSFRKVARMLVNAHGKMVPIERLTASAGETTKRHLSLLESLRVIEVLSDGARCLRDIHDIGHTLEWYVAQLCQRELHGSAEWGVKLAGMSIGGDFDVLAWLDPLLLYVETKSSPPGRVSIDELAQFLQRVEELAPDLAILLIDTDSKIDGVAERLQEVMRPLIIKASGGRRDDEWQPDKPFFRLQPDYPGIYFGKRHIYLTNTRYPVVAQLRKCLQHYHRFVKGTTFLAGPSLNYVTGEITDSPFS